MSQSSPAPTADFSALFDLSFTRFLTIGVIRIIYLLGMVLLGLGWLGLVIAAFSQGFFGGLLGIVIASIIAVVYLLVLRVWLELIVVLFRIGENTSQIASALGGAGPATGGFPVSSVPPSGQPM